MFKKISYYLPKLGQSWLIILVFAIVGSTLAAFIIAPLMLAKVDFQDYQFLIMYPVTFIPVAVFVYLMIRSKWQETAIELYKKRFLSAKTTIADDSVSAEEAVPVKRASSVKEIMEIIPNNEIEAALPSIPFNKPNFGKLGALLSFILLIPLTLSASIVIEPLVSWWEMPESMQKLFENLMGAPVVVTFLTVAIMAPLFEEWMCRGVIMRGLLYHIGPTKAILWSAFIFAFIHMNPWQAIPAFIIGVLLGWIYWRTRSIWAAIFIHFVNNGSAVLLTVLLPNLPSDASYKDVIPDNLYYLVYIAAVVICVATIMLMNKKYDKPTIPDKVQANI